MKIHIPPNDLRRGERLVIPFLPPLKFMPISDNNSIPGLVSEKVGNAWLIYQETEHSFIVLRIDEPGRKQQG